MADVLDNKVIEILAAHAKMDISKVKKTMNLRVYQQDGGLGLSETTLMLLPTVLSEKFKAKFPEKIHHKWTTVQDVINSVKQYANTAT